MMYYLSFVDPNRPVGDRSIGATVVKADSPEGAIERANLLGLNPGGEVAFWPLPCEGKEELPDEAQMYYESFVTSEIMRSLGEKSIGELDDETRHVAEEFCEASICATHNAKH